MKSLQEILHLQPTAVQTLRSLDKDDLAVAHAAERSRKVHGSVQIGFNGHNFWVEQKDEHVLEVRTRGILGTGWFPARVSFITAEMKVPPVQK